MRAITVHDGQLRWTEVPTPEPGPGEVRIRVATAGVNRADLMQRAGRYPPPPGASPVLGLECSGTIEAKGEGVDRFTLGQPVCALLSGGGYAEMVVCHASHVLPIPEGLDLTQAGALPEVFCTAWMVLRLEGDLQPGGRALVHAAASGVGTASIQLATALGAQAFATAGSAAKLARCRELGATGTASRHDGPWAPAVQAWAPDGVDVVLEPVGPAYLEQDQQVLAVGGRVVVIGLLSGREGTLDFGRLLVKRQRVIGTVLRARATQDKARIVEGVRQEIWPLVEQGRITPVIDRVVPITEAEEAHRAMQGNENVGKILLSIP